MYASADVIALLLVCLSDELLLAVISKTACLCVPVYSPLLLKHRQRGPKQRRKTPEHCTNKVQTTKTFEAMSQKRIACVCKNKFI